MAKSIDNQSIMYKSDISRKIDNDQNARMLIKGQVPRKESNAGIRFQSWV